jgi:hypothetical protein
VIPQHLGALHPVEQIATIVLAFGPFVVLGIVIAVRRRAELAEERRLVEDGVDSADGDDSSGRAARDADG